jgi:pyrimidine operon attenuation protein/uracil phosphoribosyltransferase
MQIKSVLMDEAAFDRTVMRISHEIIEKNEGEKELCIVGVLRRGADIALQIADNISRISDVNVKTGVLDITFYRDDLSHISDAPLVHGNDMGFSIEDKTVVLVDDVIYTGRTARAAMEAIIALGRPRKIQLAVLVDRGHRELPIRGDYIGKNVPTSKKELVSVRVPRFDGKKEVVIME